MAYRVQPGLHRDVAKFGGGDITTCMNCGNCTAECPQTAETGGFPRRIIHLLQVGHAVEPAACKIAIGLIGGIRIDICPE